MRSGTNGMKSASVLVYEVCMGCVLVYKTRMGGVLVCETSMGFGGDDLESSERG